MVMEARGIMLWADALNAWTTVVSMRSRKPRVRADCLIEFLQALVKDADRKVFLILGNLGAHHSKAVEQWLEPRKDRIEIFYLPGYSPELNPDERLNADLKQAIGSSVPVRVKARLKAAAESHMDKLASSPDRAKAFFQDRRCKYTAWK